MCCMASLKVFTHSLAARIDARIDAEDPVLELQNDVMARPRTSNAHDNVKRRVDEDFKNTVVAKKIRSGECQSAGQSLKGSHINVDESSGRTWENAS